MKFGSICRSLGSDATLAGQERAAGWVNNVHSAEVRGRAARGANVHKEVGRWRNAGGTGGGNSAGNCE